MGLSIWHLLVVLAIVLIIFGTRKLRDFGGDIGSAIKNFKSAVKEEEGGKEGGKKGNGSKAAPKKVVAINEKKPRVIEGKATQGKPAPARRKKKTS